MEQLNLKKNTKRGFTLTELMVSTVILGFLMAGVSAFVIDNYRMSFITQEKLDINRDIRAVTSEMALEARQANTFVIYRSFFKLNDGVPSGDLRDPINGYSGVDYRVHTNQPGDFVLFVFYGEDLNPNDMNPAPITRLIGYYRDDRDVSGEEAPVRKFDIAINGSNQYKDVEELIPSMDSADDHEEILNLVSGLAGGNLFYNINDRSVMVNGKIIHGNEAKQVTGTYNFTISPRG